MIHGSYSTYVNHDCRCSRCTEANRVANRRFRANRRAKAIPASVVHGKSATYSNWGCRCDECRAAWAASSRRQYKARKQLAVSTSTTGVGRGGLDDAAPVEGAGSATLPVGRQGAGTGHLPPVPAPTTKAQQ